VLLLGVQIEFIQAMQVSAISRVIQRNRQNEKAGLITCLYRIAIDSVYGVFNMRAACCVFQ
jgi:hypothetical protein